MIVLGLHFGHDASVAVVRDGRVVAFVEKERTTRIKKAMGLDVRDVEAALERAGIGVADVDYVTVTSTQGIEYLFFEPASLSFAMASEPVVPSPLLHSLRARGRGVNGYAPSLEAAFRSGELRRYADGERPPKAGWVVACLRQYWGADPAKMASHPSIESFHERPEWTDWGHLGRHAVDLGPCMAAADATSHHLPIVATVAGRRIPGALFSHHYAHAAYGFFSSPYDRALVLSLDGGIPDGGVPCASGMFYYGQGDRLFPLYPHGLNAGFFYKQSAILLGFDVAGADGKLMGLSSYGRPAFYADAFADHFAAQKRRLGVASSRQLVERFATWIKETAAARGMDLSGLGDAARVLEPAPAAVAASTQRIFERAVRGAIERACESLARSGLLADRLVVTGGCALNCPANSMLAQGFGFTEVFVPPGAIDSGLSIGSAQALTHAVLGMPRAGSPYPDGPAYLGGAYSEEVVRAALDERRDRITATHAGGAAAHQAADALAAGRVVGWFEGRSEIGPRALGHRSILADARDAEAWPRVNRLKGREAWRPFAPIVPVERSREFFSGAPEVSPFMLFTHAVSSNAVPAVTHVDRTARIQTVDPSCGAIHDVLARFGELTGVPVLMNTSFNGPGEPIVETPGDAIECFLARGLDCLFLEGWRVERA